MGAQERYDEIADDLCAQNAGVELGQMMGMPCVKRDGKMVAGFWRGEMVFKLPDAKQREKALALKGSHLFDPSEKGRPFKEWVAVPNAYAKEWPKLAKQALA